jgi:hypothetical protein
MQLAVILAVGYIYRISEDISSESEAQNKYKFGFEVSE